MPRHYKKRTNIIYMKEIICGKRKYFLSKDIIFVEVPNYDERSPKNLIESLNFKYTDPEK